VDEYTETYFRAVSDNRVMRYLKARGYTTVIFDETPYLYPTKTPVLADYTFVYGDDEAASSTFMLDEFGLLVIDNSMLRAFSRYYISTSPAEIAHQKMILSTISRIGDLDDISSPRFVFVHLMIPHTPFMFDEDGQLIPAAYHQNWNYYLGNYKYATKVAMQLVDNILAASDPERPPVIILQSDHGARNSDKPRAVNLENFPEEYKTNIFFALHMPGYDTTQIPQDVNPINTFPIVFNYLFGDGIPLIK
jgi:hypothetical protein